LIEIFRIAMHRSIPLLLLIALCLAACTPEEPASVVELEAGSIPSVTPRIVYVTPTLQPSPIVTVSLPSATLEASPTVASSRTPDFSEEQAECSSILSSLYTQASEACLGQPSGYFCNGGLPPAVQPEGVVSSSLAPQGALVEIGFVDRLQTSALLTNNSGGLMWVRMAESLEITAMLIGNVQLSDVTPADGNFPAWQTLEAITIDEASHCSSIPHSSFVVQGPWGRATRIAINGVSIELAGSIAVQTIGMETAFFALEGQGRFTIFGETRQIFAGQQLNILYESGDFTRPSAIPDEAIPLDFERIRNLPVALFDRPILLPQSGYAFTDGNVNLRAEPSENSRKLAEVPDNQLVSILAMNTARNWYHVRLPNGDTGWMRADLVTGDIGDITLMYDSTPPPPQRYGDAAQIALVISPTGANLRTAPDVQFQLMRVVPEGTEVEILARSPYSNFVKVDTGTEIGWVALITIETSTVIQFLPIDYDVPLPPNPTATPSFNFGGGHAYPDPATGN
jgi:uncharacterized protein YgiM (DUF1202 family)